MLGVASVVLRAAGCSFPKPPAELISHWALDETSQTGGVFDDLGPADVPMAMVGTWTDLTTASMVQAVGGTSAFTDGSGYATIAANDPAHDLSALTISFYYQRNSATAKQILLAAGNGTQRGDFSIEVLADGKLRGYHVGQDRALRFFEDGGGITGTNLQVGVAHRIDLTLGPQGARIYLDGAELAAAAIFANRNSWNNARVKYLGRWTDGILSPADGVFDRLRIWNQQLTNADIDLLEPAQSIEIGGAPPAGGELSVPSLAEWLPSDETDPTPTKYVSNQNRGNGSGSSPTNAQEVQAALNGASPGDVLLAVCQTAGTVEHWNYPNGLTFPAGTPGNSITLQARHGDAIVINAGEDYGGARTPNSGFWTQSGLSQSDIDKKIWRSSSTFTGGSQNMIGTWVEFDHVHQIIGPGSMTNLRAPVGTADSFTSYAGPCAYQDSDGRLYLRFQRPPAVKYSVGNKWSDSLWPNNPEAISNGQLAYPVSENPNDYVINIARQSPGSLHAFTISGAGHVVIGDGVNSCGFRRLANSGADNVQTGRGTHITWHVGITGSSSNRAENWFCNRTRFSCGSLRHLARSEWKFGGPIEGIRPTFIPAMSGAKHLYFLNCTLADFHEIIVMNGAVTAAGHVRFRNCAIFNLLDEGFQGRCGMPRFEIGYCYFRNSAWYGPGANGSEDDDPNPGEWFCHHNVVDARCEKNINWARETGPNALSIYHSPDHNQPRKMYNNLVFWLPDQEEEFHSSFQHLNDQNVTVTGAAAAHEVFNNIIIRHGTKRYTPAQYSDSFTDQSDFVGGRQHCDPDASNEFWDYNCYYKDVPSPVDGLFRETSESGRPGKDFASLAAFKADALFTLSKTSGTKRGAYTPGFEGNSTDTKPTLPSIDDYPTSRFQYRPSATSAVTTAKTSSLSGANWWSTPPSWGAQFFSWSAGGGSLAPSGWKGALDPSGSTITVGVLDP